MRRHSVGYLRSSHQVSIHAPCGWTATHAGHSLLPLVSIHTLRVDFTWFDQLDDVRAFQSTHPAGCDAQDCGLDFRPWRFQSAPLRVRQNSSRSARFVLGFQSTTLRVRLFKRPAGAVIGRFIHAPCGATDHGELGSPAGVSIHAPCGATSRVPARCANPRVSIHAPCRCDKVVCFRQSYIPGFQSTHPAGATACAAGSDSFLKRFNPHPAGATDVPANSFRKVRVSIHALRVRRLGRGKVKYSSSFNPRTLRVRPYHSRA